MISILTQDQAQAVVKVISTMATAGGRATRLMFSTIDGQIRIRQRRGEDILVMQIDDQGKATTTRRYTDLESFVREHVGVLGLSAEMSICPECGNKRCPKASDHRLDCTASNEPGQAGSAYA